jgi:stage II sporulation protein D
VSGRNRFGRRTFLLSAAGGVIAASAPSLFLGPRAASAADRQPVQVRVLIRRPGDGAADAPTISVSGDGEFAVTDAKGNTIVKLPAQKSVTIGRDGDAFWLKDAEGNKQANLTGPLRVNGTGDGAPLRNQSTSAGDPTPFRGTLEVCASTDGKVALVNILGIEEYLYGVVTKELPAAFGQEPLKAQAVAARTYVLARRAEGAHKVPSADVCDTAHCQVFASMAGELAAGRTAVDATRWKVLLRDGTVFEPYYSSACGGHTESIARVFGNPVPGDEDGVADGEVPKGADLGSDDGAAKFFKNSWDNNCSSSDKYRWSYSWDADQVQAMVSAGIARFQGTQTVANSAPDARIDNIKAISVPERGPSGRAMSVRFEADGVSWTVKRDWGIRNFLRTPDGALLPSSAIALDTERTDGKISKLTVYGAGYGHGAGMCQWGTRGLGAKGLAFDEILDYYYPSADLGDIPG